MAVLPEADRAAIHGDGMREDSDQRRASPVTKSEYRQIVDALDTQLGVCIPHLNTAIPAAIRANLTTVQKVRLLVMLLIRRTVQGVF